MSTARARATKNRRVLLIVGCIVAVALGSAAATLLAYGGSARGATSSDAKPVHATALVTRTDLHGTVTAPGSLDFNGSRSLAAAEAGTITALPATGSQATTGTPLYSIDNEPVVLFHGQTPAWRTFDSDMSDGPDVQELESGLAALGFFNRTPDTRFDWNTEEAIDKWQKSSGARPTGTIPFGQIVFSPGDVRVAQDTVQLGDLVGPGTPVLTLTALDKIVTAQLKISDQQVAVTGHDVSVELPGNMPTKGIVTAVGSPTQIGTAGDQTIVIPVAITLADPAASGTLQAVPVSVVFPTESRKNVLTVPVGALIARSGGGFGIEVVDKGDSTTVVPVKTGLFAGGFVEVSGTGVSAGQKVVVPQI